MCSATFDRVAMTFIVKSAAIIVIVVIHVGSNDKDSWLLVENAHESLGNNVKTTFSVWRGVGRNATYMFVCIIAKIFGTFPGYWQVMTKALYMPAACQSAEYNICRKSLRMKCVLMLLGVWFSKKIIFQQETNRLSSLCVGVFLFIQCRQDLPSFSATIWCLRVKGLTYIEELHFITSCSIIIWPLDPHKLPGTLTL